MAVRNNLRTIFNFNDCPQIISPGRLMTELAKPQENRTATVLHSVVSGLGREAALEMMERAGVRGRGGGGFPTGHKWWLVLSAEAQERFFVCNANFNPGSPTKEGWFIRTNPDKVVEAATLAAYCTGAQTAFIALPESASEEVIALENAIHDAYAGGALGQNVLGSNWALDLKVVKTPDVHIAGEETALLNFIEGKPLQPRGKPPLPTESGVFGKPTAVNNLETVLQARYALRFGSDAYRAVGVPDSPGTMVFTLQGRISRPGIYELPLGTVLRDLIFQAGGGMAGDSEFKAAFPGGLGSAALAKNMLNINLDFDSIRDAGSDMGSGMVIVLGQEDCMVEIATRLAAFFNEASCGKCKPCKDGTGRALTMLTHLDDLERTGADIENRQLPLSPRHPQLTVLNNLNRPSGVSYTDTVTGLDKIPHLCTFFRYRGDCHHTTEAASSLISILTAFRGEFNDHIQFGKCRLPKDKSGVKTQDGIICLDTIIPS
jgi:NADH:ubiquinone oxidoreductase subunit F (NADH-binding)